VDDENIPIVWIPEETEPPPQAPSRARLWTLCGVLAAVAIGAALFYFYPTEPQALAVAPPPPPPRPTLAGTPPPPPVPIDPVANVELPNPRPAVPVPTIAPSERVALPAPPPTVMVPPPKFSTPNPKASSQAPETELPPPPPRIAQLPEPVPHVDSQPPTLESPDERAVRDVTTAEQARVRRVIEAASNKIVYVIGRSDDGRVFFHPEARYHKQMRCHALKEELKTNAKYRVLEAIVSRDRLADEDGNLSDITGELCPHCGW
jgi:hypothetical protein